MKKIEMENGYIEYSEDDMNEKELVIELVEVKEKRKGTGSMLVKKVIEYAKQNDYEAVTLCAYPEDDSVELNGLIEFFESLGLDIEYDDGSEALMRYEI